MSAPVSAPVSARRLASPAGSSRRVLTLVVFGLILLLALQTWVIDWREIAGGSMAPTLRGKHRRIECSQCGISFAVGVEGSRASLAEVTCLNCGHSQPAPSAQSDVRGDRVLIDRRALAYRPPRRWETIAYRLPGEHAGAAVKRVVGLPGERVQLQDGDIYINGVRVRKSLAEQEATAILVHDARHSDHWRTLRDLGRNFIGGKSDPAWIVWSGREFVPRNNTEIDAVPVTDRYAYNQAQPVLEYHAVADLMLRTTVRWTTPEARLILRARASGEAIQATIQLSDGTIVVAANGAETLRRQASPAASGERKIVMSLVDGAWLLAMDGECIATMDWPANRNGQPASTPQLAIGTDSADVRLECLQLYRDAYYGRPAGGFALAGMDEPYSLGPAEYFVLGDNCPESVDSRYRENGPAVSAEQIIGKPLAVYWPRRGWSLGGWTIQVPDFSRIRYIR